MLVALLEDGKRVKAKKGLVAYCPGCKEQVTPKCGEVMIHHWAHKADGCGYGSGESDFHLGWKDLFDPSELEVCSEQWPNNRADICFEHNGFTYVVEIQHSDIEGAKIAQREKAYGTARLIWIFDVRTSALQHRFTKSPRFWSRKPGFISTVGDISSDVRDCLASLYEIEIAKKAAMVELAPAPSFTKWYGSTWETYDGLTIAQDFSNSYMGLKLLDGEGNVIDKIEISDRTKAREIVVKALNLIFVGREQELQGLWNNIKGTEHDRKSERPHRQHQVLKFGRA